MSVAVDLSQVTTPGVVERCYVRCDAKQLSRALKLVASVADAKSSMPILTNVRITCVDDDTIELASTDLRVSVRARVAASGARTLGAGICLPPRALLDACKGAKREVAFADVSPSFTARLIVDGGGGLEKVARSVTIIGMPVADFPVLASDDSDAKLFAIVEAAAFADLLDRASPTMSRDDTRPHLEAMLLEHDGTMLRAVSTDGHRLALAVDWGCAAAGGLPSLLLSRRSVLTIMRALEAQSKAWRESHSVRISARNACAFVSVGEYTVTAHIVDAAFPQYGQVIPQGFDRSVTIDRDALMAACSAVAFVSSDRTAGVRMSWTASELTLDTSNPDVGTATQSVECVYAGPETRGAAFPPFSMDGVSGIDEGEARKLYDELAARWREGTKTADPSKPFVIGVSSRYLTEALCVFEPGAVTVEMSGELDPILLRQGQRLLVVIMPMRI